MCDYFACQYFLLCLAFQKETAVTVMGFFVPVNLQKIQGVNKQDQSNSMAKVLLLLPHPIVLVEILHHLGYTSEKGDCCGLSAGSCRM